MIVWIVFISMILLFLAIDLGIFNKEAKIISNKEASKWTAIWASIAFLFSFVIYYIYSIGLVANPTNVTPMTATLKYISGYLVEISLSIDNIFVIAVIFNSFKIPQLYQHRVLYWGIIGAIVFRAIMILSGVAIFHLFSWTNYVFGLFLIYTAYKMITSDAEKEFNPKDSVVYKLVRKFIPVSGHIEGEKFFVKKRHLNVATPLFIALIIIELTDILFAFDSVPAIIAITSDPFIVFTSNIFAILGLRSLYFFLVNMLEQFHALEYSLAAILVFIGIKLMLHHYVHINEFVSLGFIVVALAAGIGYSIKHPVAEKK